MSMKYISRQADLKHTESNGSPCISNQGSPKQSVSGDITSNLPRKRRSIEQTNRSYL